MSTMTETIAQMSDELVIVGYQELESELEAGYLSPQDHERYIAYFEEVKRRGIKV